ncbi:hypothetical protein MTO96_001912 [Rhipicephalus appendiculatus]
MRMLRKSKDMLLLCSFLCIGVIVGYSDLTRSAQLPTESGSNGHDTANRCSLQSTTERFDCHPEPGATRDACLNRSCCWSPLKDGLEHDRVPFCYFGRDYDGYQVVGTTTLNDRVSLRLKRRTPSGVDADIQKVDVDVIYYDRDTVRIRITDAGKERFVPPVPRIPFRSFAGVRDYSVNVSPSGAITVNRSTAHGTRRIFHTDLSRLVFTDRFLQLSTLLPSDVLYGLGQHWGPLRRSLNWTSQILFNRDRAVTASIVPHSSVREGTIATRAARNS